MRAPTIPQPEIREPVIRAPVERPKRAVSRPKINDREKVPMMMLRAIAVILVMVVALVAFARVTGMPPTAIPSQDGVVQDRSVHLIVNRAGAVKVLSEDGQTVIADLASNEAGFISGVARSLAMKRQRANVANDGPVHLLRYDDGRIGLLDDASGWRVSLRGFGKDNMAAFARLLEQ